MIVLAQSGLRACREQSSGLVDCTSIKTRNLPYFVPAFYIVEAELHRMHSWLSLGAEMVDMRRI